MQGCPPWARQLNAAAQRSTWNLENAINTPLPPHFNFDRAATVASIERMKQIVANVKATVVIQHDMRDIGKLPAFPAAAK